MKLIKAIVRPNKVDDVKDALGRVSLSGMTVTEVRGHGKQKGHTAIYRGKEYDVSLLPKMEIEVVVPDNLVDDAVAAIIKAARTGEIGDGRVFVIPVEQSYRIRTGSSASCSRSARFTRNRRPARRSRRRRRRPISRSSINASPPRNRRPTTRGCS
jgi:nitrogen regulatory protein PII